MRAITTFDHVTKQFKMVVERSEPVAAKPQPVVRMRVTKSFRKRRIVPVWLFARAVLFHAWRA